MLPLHVLESIVEYLRRKDLEALLLTNLQLSTFVAVRFDNAIPRHLHLVVHDCGEGTVVDVDEGADDTYPVEIPFNDLEPRLRHSVIASVDFGSLLCECIMQALLPRQACVEIETILMPYRYSSRDVADEAFSSLFRCEELGHARPSAHAPRQCPECPPAPNVLPFRDAEYPSVGAWNADIFSTPAMQHCTILRLDNRFLDAGYLSLVIPWLHGDKQRHLSWVSLKTTEYANAMQKFVDDLVQAFHDRSYTAPYEASLSANIVCQPLPNDTSTTYTNAEAQSVLIVKKTFEELHEDTGYGCYGTLKFKVKQGLSSA